MSRRLLEALNGDHRGQFSRWLSDMPGEPRIAWYPSAGEDFRDLLYLHPQYAIRNRAVRKEDVGLPDIYLHTDYFPWSTSTFLDVKTVHSDSRTIVSIESMEELPRCDLPVDRRIVHFPEGSLATGRVVFLQVRIVSDVLGIFTRPLIYVFAENAAFCAQRVLSLDGRFSHVIHVRYGGGCGGGGSSSGQWLRNVLRRMQCEAYLSDGNYYDDGIVIKRFPELGPQEKESVLTPIRTIPSQSWSGHGNVVWNLVI